MNTAPLVHQLASALTARSALFDTRHEAAFRLFNGFLEGYPGLVVDLYARTLVIYNYADPPEDLQAACLIAQQYLRPHFPWLQAIVLKTRHALTTQAQQGIVLEGTTVARRVREQGVWYAVDLQLHIACPRPEMLLSACEGTIENRGLLF